MENAELILRVAEALKKEIGPSIDNNYPKTQAFMASVVLRKIAGELACANRHAQAELNDRQSFLAELNKLVTEISPPEKLVIAVNEVEADASDGPMCTLIEALYQHREALGDDAFSEILHCIRDKLRASINRRMEYAK